MCLFTSVMIKKFLPVSSATSDLLFVSKVHTNAMFIAEWLDVTASSAYKKTQVTGRESEVPLFLLTLTPRLTLFVYYKEGGGGREGESSKFDQD